MKLQLDNLKKMGKTAFGKMALSSAAIMAFAGIGCHGGGAYGPAWYDVYGVYCGSGSPSPGCNFYADGYKVTASEDPYYYQNYFTLNTWYYTDSYGYNSSYTGYAWLSPDGVLYNSSGYALNNADDQDSKDLVADVAEAEARVVEKAGKAFAQKYSLAEAKGVQIARTLNEYATLPLKRQRTDKDVKDFGQRLFGVNPDKAKAALDKAREGNADGLLGMNDEVATFWGTSPETSKVILKGWYKDQLSDLHVN